MDELARYFKEAGQISAELAKGQPEKTLVHPNVFPDRASAARADEDWSFRAEYDLIKKLEQRLDS